MLPLRQGKENENLKSCTQPWKPYTHDLRHNNSHNWTPTIARVLLRTQHNDYFSLVYETTASMKIAHHLATTRRTKDDTAPCHPGTFG